MNTEKQEHIPRLITPGVIATELGVPIHRVIHVLRTRTHIFPAARAGMLRLYNKRSVAMVRHELNLIDARKDHSSEHIIESNK